MTTKAIHKCHLCDSADTLSYLHGENFEIFKCNSCTNAWTEPVPGTINYEERDFHQHEISERSDAIKSISDLPEPWQNSIAKQIKLIQRHLPAGSSVLEIGCGEGIFLKELSSKGYTVFGVEPSLTGARRAAERGLNVVQGYFPTPNLADKKFDLIVMSHVFEHLENPSQILEAIKNHLTPQGKLLFIQTHYPGFVPRLLGEKWYAWVPDQHYWHFTPTGIVTITKNVGFTELEREFSELVYYNLGKKSLKNWIFFLLEKSYWMLPGKLKDQFHLMVSLGN